MNICGHPGCECAILDSVTYCSRHRSASSRKYREGLKKVGNGGAYGGKKRRHSHKKSSSRFGADGKVRPGMGLSHCAKLDHQRKVAEQKEMWRLIDELVKLIEKTKTELNERVPILLFVG